MSDIAHIDLYCNEARSIITHAEEIIQNLSHNGACEGHNLMATQTVVALKKLDQILERHRRHLAFDVLPNAVEPPNPIKRHWWSAMWRRPRGEGSAFEART